MGYGGECNFKLQNYFVKYTSCPGSGRLGGKMEMELDQRDRERGRPCPGVLPTAWQPGPLSGSPVSPLSDLPFY